MPGPQEAMPGLDQLRQQGVPVAVFHPTTFDKLFAVIQRLGVLTGEPGRAEDLNKDLQARLAAVAENFRGWTVGPRFSLKSAIPIFWGPGRVHGQ